MNRVLCGAIAILSTAAVATVFKLTELTAIKQASLLNATEFFFSVLVAFGIGALAFEVGKMIGPEAKR